MTEGAAPTSAPPTMTPAANARAKKYATNALTAAATTLLLAIATRVTDWPLPTREPPRDPIPVIVPPIPYDARISALEKRLDVVEFTMRMLLVAECLRSEGTPIIYAQIGCRSVMGR
jgi:hypothetical protein